MLRSDFTSNLLLRLVLFMVYVPQISIAWEVMPDSDSYLVDDGVYLVGFDSTEALFVESISALIIASLPTADADGHDSVMVSRYLRIGVTKQSAEETTSYCTAYYITMKDYYGLDFGIILDQANVERKIFFVASNFGGCPGVISGGQTQYVVHSILDNSDDDGNVLSFDSRLERITFQDRFK